eukprot:166875_1
MRWTINGSEFCKMRVEKFMTSPRFMLPEFSIEFQLYVYPRGYEKTHTHAQIFVVSVGELPETTPDTINISLALTTNIGGHEWKDTRIWKRKNQSFSLQLEAKIPISSIDRLKHNNQDLIMFHVDIKAEIDESKPKPHNPHNPSIPSKPSEPQSTASITHNDSSESNEMEAKMMEREDNCIDKQILSTIPSHTSSHMHSNRGVLTWTIPKQHLQRQSLQSPVFTTNCTQGAQWTFWLKNNGHSGTMDITCVLPTELHSLTVLIDVYCPQSDTYASNRLTFNSKRKEYRISQIHGINQSEYKIRFHEIKSQFKSSEGAGCVLHDHRLYPIRRFAHISWRIPSSNALDNVSKGKVFQSRRFDIWSLSIRMNEDNLILLELNLVMMPCNTEKIEIEYTLSCPSFDIEWQETTTFVRKKGKHREWKEVMLFAQQLETLKEIEFVATIEILKQYNKHGQILRSNFNDETQCVQLPSEKEEKEDPMDGAIKEDKKGKETLEDVKNRMMETQNRVIEFEKMIDRIRLNQTESKQLRKFETFEVQMQENKSNSKTEEDQLLMDEKILKLWFGNMRLPQYFEAFMEDGWDDIETIKNGLQKEHLQQMNINKQGHIVKILQHIDILKRETDESNEQNKLHIFK